MSEKKEPAVGNANDMKKIREALEMFCGYSAVVLNTGMFNRVHLEALLNKAKAALAAPPRQCDVGTVEKQKQRFKDFCKEGKLGRIDLGAYCAYDCPCRNSYDCKLEWAQTPYTESEAKDGSV